MSYRLISTSCIMILVNELRKGLRMPNLQKNFLFLALVCMGFFQMNNARAEIITQAEAQKLITKSGCMACHAIDAARVGPAYKDVAQKYANPDEETKKYLSGKTPLEYLKTKVREGTKVGVNKHWIKDAKTGRPFGMMTPNPKGRISDEELDKLLSYILSLK